MIRQLEISGMKKISLLIVCFVLISCHSGIKEEDIQKLNGYWEISQVDLPGGGKKDYKVNETIDFFELKDNQGFRQKVMPQFDGTYKTNGLKESIKVFKTGDIYFIECKTNYGKWNEEIISIEDSTLILRNKDKLEYTYKRFKPFSLK